MKYIKELQQNLRHETGYSSVSASLCGAVVSYFKAVLLLLSLLPASTLGTQNDAVADVVPSFLFWSLFIGHQRITSITR
jgi:hypothetical protein